MSDTHINVYFQDVEDAKLALGIAKGNLEAAESALKAKKAEVGYEESVATEPEKTDKLAKSPKK